MVGCWSALASSFVPWSLVLLVALALMLLLPWWPVDYPLHLPQVVPCMMVSIQSWLILSTVVSVVAVFLLSIHRRCVVVDCHAKV